MSNSAESSNKVEHKKVESEKKEFSHEKHSWPSRRRFGKIILLLGVLLLAGVFYFFNSFENQYTAISTATNKWVEHGGSVPVDSTRRASFQAELSRIQPIPMVNDGSLVEVLAESRIQFMIGQNLLNESLERRCSEEVKIDLQESVSILTRTENEVLKVLNQLGGVDNSRVPEAEVNFLNLVTSTKNLASDQINTC